MKNHLPHQYQKLPMTTMNNLGTRQRRRRRRQTPLSPWRRSPFLLYGGGMAVYLLFVSRTLVLRLPDNSSSAIVLENSCAWINKSFQAATATTAMAKKPNNDDDDDGGVLFRILCTSTRKKMHWGSYQLRCRDLQAWVQTCAVNATVVTDVSFEDIQRFRWWRSLLGSEIPYNATIFVKSFPAATKLLSLYGTPFVDLVDEYGYTDTDIPSQLHMILQTDRQGKDLFGGHNYSVVEHWYNSYPADMARKGTHMHVPLVRNTTSIHIATIWNTKRDKEPTEGGCPVLSNTTKNVRYDCLDRPFDITTWYPQELPGHNHDCILERTLRDPQLGPGKLYYNVFRKFDVLVALAKNDTMKLRYGNVQRAVSQMRSAVPVLVEVRGPVLEDFVTKYNYTCAFRRYNNANAKYWSFQQAVEQLQNPKVRTDCQYQGLVIANDYTPSKIAKKFLRTVGFQGEFLC